MHATTARRLPILHTLSSVLELAHRVEALLVDAQRSSNEGGQFGLARSKFKASPSASYRIAVPSEMNGYRKLELTPRLDVVG